ncbi:hypothetical protein [Enterovirga aerilata]|uniref:Uncharacterized protein n=1 Tax=Enterovirga aerilata TaxID=2730920 RepID=A0A849IFM3_9HYPH|nr:hypothetical protein [Enterovirga sp. DB1703]NNM74767.1 hypothetical protein [Enterovirga sp. DB1703]
MPDIYIHGAVSAARRVLLDAQAHAAATVIVATFSVALAALAMIGAAFAICL